MNNTTKIGTKIKDLRIQKGLTQEELADRCELSKGFISQLERDLTSPSIATLLDILTCLGTDLKDFFNDSEDNQIAFVLLGSITLVLGKRRIKVKKGESFYFKADSTHYIQAGQKTGAVLIWVSTPPSF